MASKINARSCNHNQNDNNEMTTTSADPVGANNNNCRQLQEQQDLVARSHELIKRRFFEKLENRRESLKMNVNMNENVKNLQTKTQLNTQTELCEAAAQRVVVPQVSSFRQQQAASRCRPQPLPVSFDSSATTMTLHLLNSEFQSLSLPADSADAERADARECAPLPRMQDYVCALTSIALRERPRHKSGGAPNAAANVSNMNPVSEIEEENLYDTPNRGANVVHEEDDDGETATATLAAAPHRAAEETGGGEVSDGKQQQLPPLTMAEADLVILPTKHSTRGDTQAQRKNDTYGNGGGGGGTLRHSHRNIASVRVAIAAEIPRDCRRDKRAEKLCARAKRSGTSERGPNGSRRLLATAAAAASLSPRSTSISIAASSHSSATSPDCVASSSASSCSSCSSASSSSSASERHGPTSLIVRSHANSDMRLNDASARSRVRWKHYARLGGDVSSYGTLRVAESSSSMSHASSLHQPRPPVARITSEPRHHGWRKLATDEEPETSSDNEVAGATAGRPTELVVNESGKCRSLNLYQNLLRTYVRHRHQRSHRHHQHHHEDHHGHHNHNHNHQHQHHHHKQSSSAAARYAHCSSTTRCGQQCLAAMSGNAAASRHHKLVHCSSGSSSEQSSSNNSKNQGSLSGGDGGGSSRGRGTAADKRTGHKFGAASVWGQLIKINKLDGSQVIELQRAPGRSWGFFVARGAINNMKGIFISRVHDNATGSSLTGLLGIGDRLLSIDNCAIEPDDILRVNQMISKKNKILLKVKPFKG